MTDEEKKELDEWFDNKIYQYRRDIQVLNQEIRTLKNQLSQQQTELNHLKYKIR